MAVLKRFNSGDVKGRDDIARSVTTQGHREPRPHRAAQAARTPEARRVAPWTSAPAGPLPEVPRLAPPADRRPAGGPGVDGAALPAAPARGRRTAGVRCDPFRRRTSPVCGPAVTRTRSPSSSPCSVWCSDSGSRRPTRRGSGRGDGRRDHRGSHTVGSRHRRSAPEQSERRLRLGGSRGAGLRGGRPGARGHGADAPSEDRADSRAEGAGAVLSGAGRHQRRLRIRISHPVPRSRPVTGHKRGTVLSRPSLTRPADPDHDVRAVQLIVHTGLLT